MEILTLELTGQYIFWWLGGEQQGGVGSSLALEPEDLGTSPCTCHPASGTEMHQAGSCRQGAPRLGWGARETVRCPSGLAPGREEQASQGPRAFPDGRVLVWLGLGV